VSTPDVSESSRCSVARKAYGFLRDCADHVPSIREVCAVTGASYSTVERGFREIYGMGPKALMTAMRLSRARHGLLHPSQTTTVTDVALQWGFFEFGRFSAQYRQRYGEVPSETLRRAELCDIALIGIGSTLPDLYNVYKTGYMGLEEVEKLRSEGIIGDICGLHFNIKGEILMDHWINQRIVTVRPDSLRKIKAVMALAGGDRKADSIFAALRGGHVHILITDDLAAKRVLELHRQSRD
jgi:AraC-like DNA-binding protein